MTFIHLDILAENLQNILKFSEYLIYTTNLYNTLFFLFS